MNLSQALASLQSELKVIYPSEMISETKQNADRSEKIKKIQSVVLDILESVANRQPPVFFPTLPWDLKSFDYNTRELYYKNLHIFKSQTKADVGIQCVSQILGIPSWELGVFATSKGLVFGPLMLMLTDGEFIDCSKKGGINVPSNIIKVKSMSSTASWVLIVEKDTTFRHIVDNKANANLGSCLFITGKGFPDVNTRILVRKVWEHLRIPILILVDADPYGFEIMCVYRFGSKAMLSWSEELACPAVRWLGVHPGEIQPLLLDSKALSFREIRKIHLLLQRSYVEENKELKSQLMILLKDKVKAEIEGVSGVSSNYLTEVYVRNKIQCKDFL